MCGVEDFIFRIFCRCILLFSREGAEDRLYATDRSGVGPEEGFFLKLSRKDEAMRYGRNGFMGTGGRQTTRLFNAARKLYLRSAIRTVYIKLILLTVYPLGKMTP